MLPDYHFDYFFSRLRYDIATPVYAYAMPDDDVYHYADAASV